MKKEKIILSATAALVGILVAVVIFFIFQKTTSQKPADIKRITIQEPTPSETGIENSLSVDEPKDDDVVSKGIITVSGKSAPDSKIVIVTEGGAKATSAGSDGKFSGDITLSKGENIIEVFAFTPNGKTENVKKVVTYTTESF